MRTHHALNVYVPRMTLGVRTKILCIIPNYTHLCFSLHGYIVKLGCAVKPVYNSHSKFDKAKILTV